MRRRLVLIAGLGAACWASAPPPSREGAAPAARPTTPPPSIDWRDGAFAARGLPAVSADGTRVVIADRGEDGARGNPNLAIAVLDRADTERDRLVVLTADEAEPLVGDDAPAPALRARIDAANRTLAAWHARWDLRPLATLAVKADPLEPLEGSRAHGEGLVIDWSAARILVRAGDRLVVDREPPPRWLVEDWPLCATCTEMCSNPAYLGAAAGDAARRILLLTISYAGTDTCWEPDSQHHVVAW